MWFWELLVVAKKVSGNNGRTSWGSQLISSSVWFPDISQSKTLSCRWVAGKFASTCSSDSSKYMHFSSPGGLNILIYISMAWHGYYCYMVLPMDGTLYHQDYKKLEFKPSHGTNTVNLLVAATSHMQPPLLSNQFCKIPKKFPIQITIYGISWNPSSLMIDHNHF